MEDPLDALLDAVTGEDRPNEWERYGLLRNPFPSRAQPVWEVFYNQEDARKAFYEDLAGFLKVRHGVKGGHNQTLLLVGGNRVGKTHFMEHHRLRLGRELPAHRVLLPMTVVSAEGADASRFFSQVVLQWIESVRCQGGEALFAPEVAAEVDAYELPLGDVRSVVLALKKASASDRDTLAELGRRWACGERLRASDRKRLGVQGLVEDAGSALDLVAGLVRYQVLADRVGGIRRPGLLLFLDEFELVYNARRDRRDLFFVVLRELIDACHDGGLFLCVGMTSGLGVEVAHVEAEYPALFARLKGARELPQLAQVADALEARGYVDAFIAHGRKLFAEANKRARKGVLPLFDDEEVRRIFFAAGHGRSVAQGDFFDAVHREANAKASRDGGT